MISKFVKRDEGLSVSLRGTEEGWKKEIEGGGRGLILRERRTARCFKEASKLWDQAQD